MVHIVFNKILVGLDGSESNLNALNYAIHLAQQEKAELVLITAVEPLPPKAYEMGGIPSYMPQYQVDLHKSLEEMQGTHLDRIRKSYPDLLISGSVKEGRAATVITDAAKDADLIVIGHRGHGGILSWVLGSVAKEVVDQCTVPVLVIKEKECARA
ncbi:MAG: universal stress protein [Nitrosomonadales bacterium]|nr:MAG: universal stress protein [Nitrosomonadales bacterium]